MSCFGLIISLSTLIALRRFLFYHLVVFGTFYHANLTEVRQEVGPHDMELEKTLENLVRRDLVAYLIDVGTLYLRHGDEMVGQLEAIIRSDTSDICKALVRVEEQFLAISLQLLRLLRQHKPERPLLVLKQLLLASDDVVLGALEAPP